MTNTAPPFGTEATYPGGEAVFAELVHLPDGSLAFDCEDCAFKEECYLETDKTTHPCFGGVYIDKLKYMQLKLVGDVE